MIKLKTIGEVTRLFTIIWIQMMAIPIEMLNLAPYRKGYSHIYKNYTHTHTRTHTNTHTHIHTHTHLSKHNIEHSL